MHTSEKLGGGSTVGIALVGALFQLFFITLLLGIGADVGLLTETERADDGERHFAHA